MSATLHLAVYRAAYKFPIYIPLTDKLLVSKPKDIIWNWLQQEAAEPYIKKITYSSSFSLQ